MQEITPSMPRPPNDSEERRPASKSDESKRARRTSTPRRSNSTTARAKLLADYPPEYRQVIELMFSFHPKQLLALVIKSVLRDRITKEELHFICNTYYSAIMDWGIYDD
jgi:hypothetical protein